MQRQVGRTVSAKLALVLAAGVLLGACSGASATPVPVTAAPVTAAPVTAAPVTAAPVTAAPVKDVRLSVVFYAKVIAYFNDMISGMEDKAKELGIKLDVSYANFDVEEQKNLVDTALGTSPSGMIIAPFNPAAFLAPLQKASGANIPVIMVGDDVTPDAQALRLAFVGPSFKEMGVRKAQWIADKLGGKGTVIVIHGPKGLDFVEGIKVGYQEVFAKYPDIKVIEGPYGNIASDVGRQSTEDMLTANPNPSAIMYDSEDIALGGIAALKGLNIAPGKILMVASDGVKAGIQAVKDGTLDMTVSENAYVNGMAAIQVLYDQIVNGTKPASTVPIELVTITKDNIGSLPANILPPGQ